MAAPLDGLIFDAVYGSWILSLLLFTLGNVTCQSVHYPCREFTTENVNKIMQAIISIVHVRDM